MKVLEIIWTSLTSYDTASKSLAVKLLRNLPDDMITDIGTALTQDESQPEPIRNEAALLIADISGSRLQNVPLSISYQVAHDELAEMAGAIREAVTKRQPGVVPIVKAVGPSDFIRVPQGNEIRYRRGSGEEAAKALAAIVKAAELGTFARLTPIETADEGVTLILWKQYVSPAPGERLVDRSGDIDHPALDLQSMEVTVTDEDILARVEMRDIPGQIRFAKDGVPDNAMEYHWAVTFDVNNDYYLSEGDIELALSYFKTERTEFRADLLVPTQKSIWLRDSEGGASNIGELTVTVEGDELVFATNKSILEPLRRVSPSTPVSFTATYHNGVRQLEDNFP